MMQEMLRKFQAILDCIFTDHFSDHLWKASDLASQIGSMGWQGRIATLQARLIQEHPELASIQRDSPEQLQRRADALRAALASLSAEEEGPGKEFHIYIPWQTR
jgi:hypothetical protein